MAQTQEELAVNAQELLTRLRDTLVAFGAEKVGQENFINNALAAQAFLFAELLYTIEHDLGESTVESVVKEWSDLVEKYMDQMRQGKAERVPFEKSDVPA